MVYNDIIQENKNLIYSIANIYRGYVSMEDLFQAGCIGIIEAYKKYDESKNTKFSTFAYPYILGEVNKCIRDDNPIKISRPISSLRRKIEKVRENLAQEIGHMPSDSEIINYMDVSMDVYYEAINSISCVESLDYNVSPENDMYEIVGTYENPLDSIELQMELEKLKPLDREIIMSHYIYDETQKEIAAKIGLNQVAVSRREKKVLQKLRFNLE